MAEYKRQVVEQNVSYDPKACTERPVTNHLYALQQVISSTWATASSVLQ